MVFCSTVFVQGVMIDSNKPRNEVERCISMESSEIPDFHEPSRELI